eukprot:12778102-Ditylum_brightwellii.AAC.1
MAQTVWKTWNIPFLCETRLSKFETPAGTLERMHSDQTTSNGTAKPSTISEWKCSTIFGRG